MNRICIMCLMHEYTDFTKEQLQRLQAAGRKLGYDVYALYNHDVNNINLEKLDVYLFNNQVVTQHNFRKRYYYDYSQLDFYGNNIEFSFLSFYEDHSNYDYYWLVEYDVHFTGEWGDFFKYFEKYNHDFLTSHIGIAREDWSHRHLIWCRTFNPSVQYQCLNPLDRFSNKALSVLVEHYRKGDFGFYETFPITLFKYIGLKCGDFSKDFDIKYLDYSTFDWKGEYFELLPNKIYHPIKSL